MLIDKDRRLADFADAAYVAGPPSGEEFLEAINWFWAAALMTAKMVVRDEPWCGQIRLWDANKSLLRMVEWEHRARYGWDHETWFNGKHLRDWADDDAFEKLAGCLAGLDSMAIRAALTEAMSYFVRIAVTTAEQVGVEFDHDSVRREVERILAGRMSR